MLWVRRLLVLAVFVGVLVGGWRFAAQNSETLAIDYLVGRLEGVPVWLALSATFLAGAAAASLLAFYQTARLKLTARRYRRVVNGLEAEVHQLRNLPLAGEGAPGAAREQPGLERGS